jgi:hypothetical protein
VNKRVLDQAAGTIGIARQSLRAFRASAGREQNRAFAAWRDLRLVLRGAHLDNGNPEVRLNPILRTLGRDGRTRRS